MAYKSSSMRASIDKLIDKMARDGLSFEHEERGRITFKDKWGNRFSYKVSPKRSGDMASHVLADFDSSYALAEIGMSMIEAMGEGAEGTEEAKFWYEIARTPPILIAEDDPMRWELPVEPEFQEESDDSELYGKVLDGYLHLAKMKFVPVLAKKDGPDVEIVCIDPGLVYSYGIKDVDGATAVRLSTSVKL